MGDAPKLNRVAFNPRCIPRMDIKRVAYKLHWYKFGCFSDKAIPAYVAEDVNHDDPAVVRRVFTDG